MLSSGGVIMNFGEKITQTIKNPKSAMKSIAEQPMIEEAVMIVGIVAVLGALAAYIQTSKITIIYEGFENMPASMQQITAVIAVVGGLISPLFIWVIGTGILHLISLGLGGEGKFYPQMMTVIGYSMIPTVFGTIIGIGLLSMIEPMTVTISRTNPMAAGELYNNPYLLAYNIIDTILLVWTSIIIFFGVQNAQKLAPSKAAIVAAIPLALSFISLAWSIWSRSIV